MHKNDSTKERPAGNSPQASFILTDKQSTELKSLGIDLAAHFLPSSDIGGDSWGFRKISDTELGIYTVDVSGRGVETNLNSLKMRSYFNQENNFVSSTDIFLKNINNRMVGLLPTGQFATMFYAVIDVKNNLIRYSSAASPGGIIVKKNGEVIILKDNSFPLGIVPNADYSTRSEALSPGDSVILYSDALIETAGSSDSFIASEELNSVITANKEGSAVNILNSVLNLFGEHIGSRPVSDDLTINIYKRF